MLRYFGPPGTGKTTTLLNEVERLLGSGYSPNEIGYFAFTRKASHEARDRAVMRFNMDPEKDFTYFRTLHSLAFQTLGLTAAEVLKEAHLKEFGHLMGLDLTSGVEKGEDDGFIPLRSNHPLMRCIDLSRNMLQDPAQTYNSTQLSYPFYEVQHIFQEYAKFKQSRGLKDFTDMLVELAANPAHIPTLKVVFLDEAQDLTPLQWQIAHLLNDKCERMFIAGDDDQGIYRWAGADVNHFISLEGGSEVLSQSYRVPKAVFRLADSVANRIRNRQKKKWLPRDDEGTVQRAYDTRDIEFNNANWLVLAQANYMLNDVAAHLKATGVFFERFNTPSLSKSVRSAISSWEYLHLGDNREISLNEAVNLYAHLSSRENAVARGAKKLLKAAHENDTFSLSVLRKHYGLEATGRWETALDKIRDEDRAYATAMINRGVDLSKRPLIKLSTIHGAKGGEATNVLLYLDLSGKAVEEMGRNPDDAHRVLYVGITRTKQNLVLKMPDDAQKGWAL